MTTGATAPARRWVDDLVQYFNELGGEAHYSDRYAHIQEHPRRHLGKEWQRSCAARSRNTLQIQRSGTSDGCLTFSDQLMALVRDVGRFVTGSNHSRWLLVRRSSAPYCTTHSAEVDKAESVRHQKAGTYFSFRTLKLAYNTDM